MDLTHHTCVAPNTHQSDRMCHYFLPAAPCLLPCCSAVAIPRVPILLEPAAVGPNAASLRLPAIREERGLGGAVECIELVLSQSPDNYTMVVASTPSWTKAFTGNHSLTQPRPRTPSVPSQPLPLTPTHCTPPPPKHQPPSQPTRDSPPVPTDAPCEE